MAKENMITLDGGEVVELSDERIASFQQGAYYFERRIWYRHVKGGMKSNDLKSFLAYHKEKNTHAKAIARNMRLTPKGQLWADANNPLFVYWLQQIYAPNLQRVELMIDGVLQEMPEGLRLLCEEEVEALEEQLAECSVLGFCNVDSYCRYCKNHGTCREDITDELRVQKFSALGAENNLGLIWLWQIYLPRVKAGCLVRNQWKDYRR